MSDLIREDFEKWYVDKWYEWRLHQGYGPVSKQEMLQNIVLMRCEEKYENGKDYLNHAWEGWQAAIASMQGEAKFVGLALQYGNDKTATVFDADIVPIGTRLFINDPDASARIAEQNARIKELEQQLEVARKDAECLSDLLIEAKAEIQECLDDHCNMMETKPHRPAIWQQLLGSIDDAIRQIGGAE